jgi:hypothetical protein
VTFAKDLFRATREKPPVQPSTGRRSPVVSSAKKKMLVSEVVDIAGKWKGRWNCWSEGHTTGVLILKQTYHSLAGSLTMKKVTTIIEQLSGVIEDDKLILRAVSAHILRPGGGVEADAEYKLDSFVLGLSTDRRKLTGTHECDMGQGRTVFERL